MTNNKKVGLLTYHHTTNFGSLLQTYALAKAVDKLGMYCEIIDYRNNAVEAREKPKKITQYRNLRGLIGHIKYEPSKKKKAKKFSEFTKRYLKVSENVYDLNNISSAGDKYDCYLVGSDLVWDFSINDYDYTYMLDFTDEHAKRIAFASSVGKIWEDNDMAKVTELLNRFNHIGVREFEIQSHLNNMLDSSVDFVCDPTMLITPDEWKMMASKRLIPEKYVLCYFADSEMKIYKDAIRYGKENNLPVYLVSYNWVPKEMKAIRPAKVEDFLSLILNAETVFSASYHGMLFSLYFNKDFYYYNRGWRARMRSIAQYLDIEQRENLPTSGVADPIDYQKVNVMINSFREESLNRLKRYLED